ncbi:MAG: ATPase, partial [Paramuribaculum sp.]|nr:ATPase [Paramuribaculum sp.]
MLLIADSGSTKTQWAIAGGGDPIVEFQSPGLNPSLMSDGEIEASRREALSGGDWWGLEAVYFDG